MCVESEAIEAGIEQIEPFGGEMASPAPAILRQVGRGDE